MATATDKKTLSQLAKSVKCSSEYGAKLAWDKQDDWQQKANGYSVTLRYRGRQMTVDFWMGTGLNGEPQADSVLSSLLLDSSAIDQTFEDWCGEFGYDTDSRKAEKTYKACVKNGERLKRLLGDDFETFLYAKNDV